MGIVNEIGMNYWQWACSTVTEAPESQIGYKTLTKLDGFNSLKDSNKDNSKKAEICFSIYVDKFNKN